MIDTCQPSSIQASRHSDSLRRHNGLGHTLCRKGPTLLVLDNESSRDKCDRDFVQCV